MIIELIIIVVLCLILKWIYFNNLLFYLLFYLDLFAEIITRFSLLIKSKDKIIDFNLNLVYQKKLEINESNKLKYTSLKISILNFLIALHQRFIIDTNFLFKNYENITIPDELKEDIKNNKVIFAQAHYGIYTDYTSYYRLLSKVSYVYKMNINLIEKFFYHPDSFKNKMQPH